MEIKSILKNELVKDILEKANIPQDKLEAVAHQAINTIKGKIEQHPAQMNRLISGNPQAETNQVMRAEVEHAFVNNLVHQLGISEHIANKVKGVLPTILNQFSGKLSIEGLKDLKGIPTDSNAMHNILGSGKKKGENEQHEKKPFENPPKNIPSQGHTSPDDHKIGVQYHGGSQGGGSFKKNNKG